MEPASDPATAKSARNRKSKITCDEHSSSDRACRQSGRIEDSGGKRKAMEQIDTLSTVVSTTVDLVAVAGAMALPLGPPTVP
jgi:hypothetical protein